MISDIIIGGDRFCVHEVTGAEMDPDDNSYVGRVSFSRSVITVLKEATDDHKKQTICHEIMHVICQQRNVELSERALDALAYGLRDLIISNPGLSEMMG